MKCNCRTTDRLEGNPPATGLGVCAARLEAARRGRGLGCPGPRCQWASKARQEGVPTLRQEFWAAAKRLLAKPEVLHACAR